MDEPTRRTPVYRHVQPDNSNGHPQPQTVMFTINDGMHPYAPLMEETASDEPAAPPGEGEFDYLAKVMFALRGRWWLAIVLAVIGGAAGAYVGYHFKPVTYRSEGVISVAYSRPKVLREADNAGSLTLFDSHLTSQTDVIKSRDVVERALKTDIWHQTGKGSDPKVAGEVGLKLIAEHPVQSELIRVKYTDSNPYVAAAAVNAVMTAFKDVYTEQAAKLDIERMALLEDHRTKLSGKLQSLEDQMSEEITNLVARTRPIAPAPVPAPAPATQPGAAQIAPIVPIINLSLRDIAREDVAMREYLAQLESMQDTLQRTRDAGAGENHPDFIRQQRAIERHKEKINRYAYEYQQQQAAAAQAVRAQQPSGTAPAPAPAPPAMTAALPAVSSRYDSLKAEAGRVRDELHDTLQRIETLRMENSVGSKVSIVAKGEVPGIPYADSQLKLGAVGGLAGMGFPLGLLIAWGLLGGKYRFSDDAETEGREGVPLLGILPMLSEHREELEKRADAAHCIHQIRAILQMRRPMQSSYLITSATAGEGKTSLTAAMAFAFAASGARTLLIDADLIGQRLTGGFKSDRLPGLHECIMGEEIENCVKRIDHGLRFMPVGRTDALGAWTISATGFRKVLTEARKHFDVVLVDTGPALGSVEASVVAPEVDGVIFTIARGQQRWLVEKATKHVKAVGGKLIGMVFNRAEARDFNRSAFRSSVRSSTMPQEPDWSPRRDLPEANRLGPLVKSVATLLPANGGGRS